MQLTMYLIPYMYSNMYAIYIGIFRFKMVIIFNLNCLYLNVIFYYLEVSYIRRFLCKQRSFCKISP